MRRMSAADERQMHDLRYKSVDLWSGVIAGPKEID